MDSHKVHHRNNPRLNANVFSKLFFCWIIPYLFYGAKHELETKDIFELGPENRNELLGDKLEKCWKAEVKEAQKRKRRPCLWKAIVKTFGCTYLKYAVLAVGAVFVPMLVPLVLKRLIFYFDENSTFTMLEAYLYAFLFTLIVTLETLLSNHSRYSMSYIGEQVKTSCSAIVYRKVLRIPINSQNRLDGGRIITLLSNDVARFEEAFQFIVVIFILPIIFIMNSILIWRNLGATAVVLVLIVILQYMPLQVFSVYLMTMWREKAAEKTDYRLLLMDEIINGIRLIKMYTWEKPMEQLILLVRRKELDFIAKKLYFNIGLRAFFKTGQCISLYLTMATDTLS